MGWKELRDFIDEQADPTVHDDPLGLRDHGIVFKDCPCIECRILQSISPTEIAFLLEVLRSDAHQEWTNALRCIQAVRAGITV